MLVGPVMVFFSASWDRGRQWQVEANTLHKCMARGCQTPCNWTYIAPLMVSLCRFFDPPHFAGLTTALLVVLGTEYLEITKWDARPHQALGRFFNSCGLSTCQRFKDSQSLLPALSLPTPPPHTLCGLAYVILPLPLPNLPTHTTKIIHKVKLTPSPQDFRVFYCYISPLPVSKWKKKQGTERKGRK